MRKLKIRNIGPIKNVELNINIFNVFIGPQSSGKSTIAKIISQSLWAEKNYLTIGDEYDFAKGLILFHNFDSTYFSAPDTLIQYNSPWCSIEVKRVAGKRNIVSIYKRIGNSTIYNNTKIQYIPAERNFVASISNIRKYTENYNSTISFLGEWHKAKSIYHHQHSFKVDLPELHFAYRYKENEEKDIIRTEHGVDVALQSSSSGQQSLLPLLVVMKEVMCNIYNNQKIFSPAEISHMKRNAPELSSIIDALSYIDKKVRNRDLEQQLKILWDKIGFNPNYGETNLIVEEPEQNLYPSTQRGLVREMISCLKADKKHQHSITLTTHSPYILYALNNCMLKGLVNDSLYGDSISPRSVSIYLLYNGTIQTLQNQDTGLLEQNTFNDEFQKNHEEMFELLKQMATK